VTSNACWTEHGVTIAGGNGEGNGLEQLHRPWGLFVDDDGTVFVADHWNHRILAWKKGGTVGHIVAGGQGRGNELYQLRGPTDVLVEKKTNSLIISDYRNRRVLRWPLNNAATGEILVDKIRCCGLAMDNQGCLHVSDEKKREVRRFTEGDTKGKMVASETENILEQLHSFRSIFVDEEQSVYVSDRQNHRVLKWLKNEMKEIVVAGGKGRGNDLTQLNDPTGVWVDSFGTVYVAESGNDRVTRWRKGETIGTLVVGGNGRGDATNQFNCPQSLFIDRHGYLYVVDRCNHRVQRFTLKEN
jgi:sugar lactone lactonase YvrE